MLKIKELSFIALGVFAASGTFIGCGKQEFQKQQVTAQSGAIGFRHLPAKLDVLIVPDDSASMSAAIGNVNNQVSSFVSGLQGQYWDYHVARSFMSKTSPINQVLVSPQFNSPYLSDGTFIGTNGLVPSDNAIAVPPSNWIIPASYSNAGVIDDRTYQNVYTVMANAKADTTTNFLRDDALLAVIVLTNGGDGSVDQWTLSNIQRPDGLIDAGKATTFNAHVNNWLSIKDFNAALTRFYPIAAMGYHSGSGTDKCNATGGASVPGGSYFEALSAGIPGAGFDFCDPQALQRVLYDISQNLTAIKQAYVYSAIVLDEEPIESTLVVAKNGQAIPRDSLNGWQYVGLDTAYTITGIADQNLCPTQDLSDSNCIVTPLNPGLNRRTGYLIQLNGTARMLGRDTPTVQYEAR